MSQGVLVPKKNDLLSTENDVNTRQYESDLRPIHFADELGQERPVYREDLRNIRHGVLRKVGYPCGQEDVAWRCCPSMICRQRYADYR